MNIRRSIAIAVAAHAAIFIFFPRSPRGGSAPETSTPRDTTEAWEVALEAPLESARAETQAGAHLDRIDESHAARVASREVGEIGKKERSADDATPTEAPATAAPTAWSFSPTVPNVDDPLRRSLFTRAYLDSLGSPSTGLAEGAAQGAGDEQGPPRPPGPTHSTILRDGLHAADVAKGRAIGNPILKVARDVTLQQPSPVVGDAIFEVRIDGKGHIVDLRVTGCDGDPRAWDAVKRGLLVAFEGHPIPIFESASRGALVSFAIKSRWALPSGQAPGLELGLPLLPGIKTSKSGGKDPARLNVTVLPGDGAAGRKPKDITVSLGTDVDMTSIGAKAQRTVSTRIVGEKLL